jgi:hypothetical protein
MWFAIAVLVIASTALAEESPGVSDLLFVIETTVESDSVGAWAGAVAATAKAHAAHPDGNFWAAYRQTTGGPETVVRFFVPLTRMADLDGWSSNRKILIDVLGQDTARGVIHDLETDVRSNDRILSFNATLSRPWSEAPTGPSKYVWVASVRVEPGKEIEYAAVFNRLRRAIDQHDTGVTWLAYGNAVGGDGSEILFFYPFGSFSEIDGWRSKKEALTNAYGPNEAARILSALEAISETTTSLWQLEPALSQLEQ